MVVDQSLSGTTKQLAKDREQGDVKESNVPSNEKTSSSIAIPAFATTWSTVFDGVIFAAVRKRFT